MPNLKNIIVDNSNDETRIDRWLKRKFPFITQSFIQNKLRRGLIKINNKKVKANYIVLSGHVINIIGYSEKIYSKTNKLITKKNISKKISNLFKQSKIFESKDFIIIDKWTGISTQGGKKSGVSISDIIKNLSSEFKIVHRLDKDTSGLLIIAKNYKASKYFGKLFKNHEIEKMYIAVCQGIPVNDTSIVNLKIKSKKTNKALNSVTQYKVLYKSNKLSLILYKPLTGRMHQLRIVSKHLNCPIIGDKKYKNNNDYSNILLKLNAFNLKFTFNNQEYNFNSSLPSHFRNFLKEKKLKFEISQKIFNF